VKRSWAILLLLAAAGCGTGGDVATEGPRVRIGTKKFAESQILGHTVAHLARDAGGETDVRTLGGTEALFQGLLSGEIDVYPEYTGTISEQILHGQTFEDEDAMRAALAEQGIVMGGRLGFNNTYVLGMLETRADELSITAISDLVRHADLVFGFSSEFLARGDGWPSLRQRYALPQQDVKGMDHNVAYEALLSGAVDVIDLYSTDAEIQTYQLRALADDRRHFPDYHSVLLYRADFAERAPKLVAALSQLEGRIDESTMIAMNVRAKIEQIPAEQVAADFVNEVLGVAANSQAADRFHRIVYRTGQHLVLVGLSLTAAILLAVPLGIWAAARPRAAQGVLAVTGIVQTIPSLALLVLMIPLLGVGAPPAIVALFLYSLLPILRNTYAGLHDIRPAIRESAAALGLSRSARLLQVELPIASRTILAGIKTAAVINVGTATLGALIGAGGYGQPILTGIDLRRNDLILEGAVPAALLALAVQVLFEAADRWLVPKGLRLKPSS